MVDNIITEQDSKRLMPNKTARAEDGVAQSAHIFLPYIVNVHIGGLANEVQQIIFSLARQLVLECRRGVEVILDGTLSMTTDDEDVLDAARECLLHNVLDGRLVYNGQHFLRRCLRRREEPRSVACGGNNGFAYALFLFHLMYSIHYVNRARGAQHPALFMKICN